METNETAINKLIKQFYSSFTNTGDKVAELYKLFDKNGQVIQFLPTDAMHYSISSFIGSREKILKSGIYSAFEEYELDASILVNGKHAVRLSTYQKEGIKEGEAFRIQGTKVFQLLKQKDEWIILSFTWMDDEAMKEIEIRLLSADDSKLLFRLMTGKNWLEQIGERGIKDIEDAKNYILERMHPDLNEKGFINHVIIDKKTREEVGTCSLHNREGVDGLDVGYAILEGFERKGYATLATKLMVRMAFNTYDVNQVSAITTDGNHGSCRVLEKVGFTHNGYVLLPNGKEKLKLYVLKKSDWID